MDNFYRIYNVSVLILGDGPTIVCFIIVLFNLDVYTRWDPKIW